MKIIKTRVIKRHDFNIIKRKICTQLEIRLVSLINVKFFDEILKEYLFSVLDEKFQNLWIKCDEKEIMN